MTETVQRMERNGLISRVRDCADKRSVRVGLTRKARGLEPRCHALASQMKEVLEQGFARAEARRLRADLSRVIQNLHEHLKPTDSN